MKFVSERGSLYLLKDGLVQSREEAVFLWCLPRMVRTGSTEIFSVPRAPDEVMSQPVDRDRLLLPIYYLSRYS